MVLDVFREENIKVVFSYLPVWEMFFSMHVLANPEHHTARRKWVETKEKKFSELVRRIRELSGLTNSWNIIIDSDKWGRIRQMDIDEMLSYFQKKNINQWNDWIKYSGKTMTIKQRNEILELVKQYYYNVFLKEERIIRPYLMRVIESEEKKCKESGAWEWCKDIHSRLSIEEDTVTYLKNREFKIEKKDINTLFITVSTFVYPHLWLYKNNHELEIVKAVLVERSSEAIPKDFVQIFKVLGDSTRLQIIKYLLQGVCTTQALAKEMQLSEAAISKHLKLMWGAGFLLKTRKGFYVEYKFKLEMVDYIPYVFYETMMQ